MHLTPPKTKELLVRRVVQCAHKGRSKGVERYTHRHARYGHEMIYVDYGAMRLVVAGDEEHVRAGECVLIPGGKQHSVNSEAGMPFNFLNIMFRGAVPDALFAKPLALNRHGLDLVERLKREVQGGLPRHYEAILCCFTDLLVQLVRQISAAEEGAPVEPAYLRHHHSEMVRRALEIITANYADPLTLKRVSRAVGASPSYLHVLLKRETDQTFTQLLHKRRVQMAKHMLQDTPMALKQVIPAVGYTSPAAFFRVFKKVTGMTPAAYARSLGEPSQK